MHYPNFTGKSEVIQNAVNTGRFDKNTKIHTEPFIVPKKFASNIRTPLTKPISTSNTFELLYSENVLEANRILSTEINNTVKENKTKNSNTSNENRESAPKNKRNCDGYR